MAKQFRVYPGLLPSFYEHFGMGKHYFKVIVYPTCFKMYRAYKRYSPHGKCDFDAIVLPRQVERFDKGKHTLSPFLGYILLTSECLNIEVLVHEATHAALYYVKRIQKSKDEEELCYATGRIARVLIEKYRNWA